MKRNSYGERDYAFGQAGRQVHVHVHCYQRVLGALACAVRHVLTPLFRSSSTLSVAIAALVLQVTLVPLMVTMLEYEQQRSASGETHRLASLVGHSTTKCTRPRRLRNCS